MMRVTTDRHQIYEFLLFLRYKDRVVPAMVFVNGENLAMRYKSLAQEKGVDVQQTSSLAYEPDVLIWSSQLKRLCEHAGIIRKHYYTSVIGPAARKLR
jgi:hypothetical protein